MPDPTDIVAARVAEQQKQQYGITAQEAFFAQTNKGSAVDRLHQKRIDAEKMLSYAKIAPWSVINLMPFPLNINGTVHRSLVCYDGNQVPAAPSDIPVGWRDTPDLRYGHVQDAKGGILEGTIYVQRIIRNYEFSIKDEESGADGVSNCSPVPHLPRQLAEEFDREFIVGKQWGVIIYEGEEPPTSPGMFKKLREALTASNAALKKMVEIANAISQDPRQAMLNRNNERLAAHVLYSRKILKELPKYVISEQQTIDQDIQACPGCGAIPDRGASLCKHCPYVFDPMKAYENNLIEFGHGSMSSFSTDEWKKVKAIKEKRDKAKAAAGIQ